jgi:hypothetical protein
VIAAGLLAAELGGHPASAQAGGRGTVKGHVRLAGKPPGNPVIRMGMDPMCTKINGGKRVVQATVAASIDGSLGNVFVAMAGPFPASPVPSAPAVLDQRGCIYTPRVIGARVGQLFEVRNSDDLLHNVHGLSDRRNGFNVSEPKAGMVQQFRLKDEEVMLRLKCDVHSWMTAYVGIVPHSHFSVTDAAGNFEVSGVPVGARRIRIWHERYGEQTKTVQVTAGSPVTVAFSFSGDEKPAASRVVDLTLPAAGRVRAVYHGGE